jgi:hypothetical protein
VLELSKSIALLELANFLNFIIHVRRTMQLCATITSDDWRCHFYSFFFCLVLFVVDYAWHVGFCVFNDTWCWNLEGHSPLQCLNRHYLIGLMCITWGMWGGDSISRSTWHWEEVKFSCIWFFVKVLGFFKF